MDSASSTERQTHCKALAGIPTGLKKPALGNWPTQRNFTGLDIKKDLISASNYEHMSIIIVTTVPNVVKFTS